MPLSWLDPIPAWAWAAALAAVVLLWWLAATRTRRRNAWRARRARRAEGAAERLLAARGYAIVDRQVTVTWTLSVDGVPTEVRCRADLLVRRGRRIYVAEVKSAGAHTDPTHPHTRRQLLEYLHAFEVDGVLLVDMQGRAVIPVGVDPP